MERGCGAQVTSQDFLRLKIIFCKKRDAINQIWICFIFNYYSRKSDIPNTYLYFNNNDKAYVAKGCLSNQKV